MKIELGELSNGSLVLASDDWFPHAVKRVEYYEGPKIINVIFDVTPEESKACNCEIPPDAELSLKSVDQMLIIENATSESGKAYHVELEVVSSESASAGLMKSRMEGDSGYVATTSIERVPVAASADSYDEFRMLMQVDRTAPAPVEEAVLRRDDWRCWYCGFRSYTYQMVVRSGRGSRLPEAMNVACPFCSQVAKPAMIPRRKSGVLVWLPELSQIEVNECARAFYVARIGRDESAQTAQRLLHRVVARREDVPEKCGISYNPVDLVNTLQVWEDSDGWNLLGPYFAKGARIWPLDRWMAREGGWEFNKFPQMIAHWRSSDGPLPQEDAAATVTRYAGRLRNLLAEP